MYKIAFRPIYTLLIDGKNTKVRKNDANSRIIMEITERFSN